MARNMALVRKDTWHEFCRRDGMHIYDKKPFGLACMHHFENILNTSSNIRIIALWIMKWFQHCIGLVLSDHWHPSSPTIVVQYMCSLHHHQRWGIDMKGNIWLIIYIKHSMWSWFWSVYNYHSLYLSTMNARDNNMSSEHLFPLPFYYLQTLAHMHLSFIGNVPSYVSCFKLEVWHDKFTMISIR